jgi:hypothetical protein
MGEQSSSTSVVVLHLLSDISSLASIGGATIVPESREQLCARTNSLLISHINYVLSMCGMGEQSSTTHSTRVVH